MARIKEGLKDIKTLDLIAKSRHIISQITQNLIPAPMLAQVIAATEALVAANNAAYGRGSYSMVVKREKRKALLLVLKSLAGWVQAYSMGSREIIVKSGFEVCRGNTRLGILPPPKGLRTLFTRLDGGLPVRWKPVHGKKTYILEINAGDVMDESQWKRCLYVSKTSALIKNLESQKKYWVRVKTVSTAGVSVPSGPVQGLVW